MFNVDDLMSKADEKSANEKKALFEAFINLSLCYEKSVWPDDVMDCLDTICDDPRISVDSFRWCLSWLREVVL